MKRIIALGCVLGTALLTATQASEQRSFMSDASGTNPHLFSRGVVRAFGAPPAPPPVLLVTPAIMNALCLERADALLTYALLSNEADTKADYHALAGLRRCSSSVSASSTMNKSGCGTSRPIVRATAGGPP